MSGWFCQEGNGGGLMKARVARMSSQSGKTRNTVIDRMCSKNLFRVPIASVAARQSGMARAQMGSSSHFAGMMDFLGFPRCKRRIFLAACPPR